MKLNKEHRRLAEVLAQHGLSYHDEGKHYIIRKKDGSMVASVGRTPSDMHFARQTIRHLVRDGVLPPELRKIKF